MYGISKMSSTIVSRKNENVPEMMPIPRASMVSTANVIVTMRCTKRSCWKNDICRRCSSMISFQLTDESLLRRSSILFLYVSIRFFILFTVPFLILSCQSFLSLLHFRPAYKSIDVICKKNCKAKYHRYI